MSDFLESGREERDAAIRAILPHVPACGWSRRAIGAGLADAGMAPEDAAFLFPRGPLSAIDAWLDLTDRGMAAAAGDLSGLRTPGRVRALVAARLRLNAAHKDALRQAVALLALPWNAPHGLRGAARTADAIWRAAGDRSADTSWYTRRASLAAIYGATLAFWLRDGAEDPDRTLAFLDRRLEGLARMMQCSKRFRVPGGHVPAAAPSR